MKYPGSLLLILLTSGPFFFYGPYPAQFFSHVWSYLEGSSGLSISRIHGGYNAPVWFKSYHGTLLAIRYIKVLSNFSCCFQNGLLYCLVNYLMVTLSFFVPRSIRNWLPCFPLFSPDTDTGNMKTLWLLVITPHTTVLGKYITQFCCRYYQWIFSFAI